MRRSAAQKLIGTRELMYFLIITTHNSYKMAVLAPILGTTWASLLASVLQAASARDFLNAGALEAATRGRDLLKLEKLVCLLR